MRNAEQLLQEVEVLCAEFMATKPKIKHTHSRRVERWENDYEARHRFDLATRETINGAKYNTGRYAFSLVQDDYFERMMAAEYAD